MTAGGTTVDVRVVPLSAAQESMWFEHLLHPDAINGGIFSVTITGPIEEALIRDACAAVCEHNPQLCGVVLDGPTPQFAIHPVERYFAYRSIALPAAPGTEFVAARHWYARELTGPWDLTRHTAIRYALLRHDPERRTLLVSVHHIAFDGRSKFLFARQFTAFLNALRAGDPLPPPGPVLPHPPIDLELDDAVRSWMELDLASLAEPVLPYAERAEPPGSVDSTPRFHLSGETIERLRSLTQDAGVSYFAGLVAGVAAQLHTYGNDDLVIGIPVDTSDPTTRDHIGLQVDVVPCLVRVPPEATFRRLVAVTGTALREVYRYRRVPFSLVLRDLRRRLGTDVGRGVFDRFGISYPSVVGDLGTVPGLTLDWDLFAPNTTSSFHVIVQLRRAETGTYGRIDFETSVLDMAGAAQFADGLTGLLEVATAQPDRPLPVPVAARTRPGAEVVAPSDPATFTQLVTAIRTPAGARALHCRFTQFLPTTEVAGAVRDGRPLVLDVVDPRDGYLGTCDWHPDGHGAPRLVHAPHGYAYEITSPVGRPLPVGVPGLLRVVGRTEATIFRAVIDRDCTVGVLGTRIGAVTWMGRALNPTTVETALAALPGVGEVAVDLDVDGSAARVAVFLVPVSDDDTRNWRRTIRRAWLPGWPPASEIVIVEALPRIAGGEVDRVGLRARHPHRN